jgi:hypothetical protein
MILICEPQCVGFEHAEVNASLIEAVCTAYPQEAICFAAEQEHYRLVMEQLTGETRSRLTPLPLKVPLRWSRDFVRMLPEYFMIQRVFAYALENKLAKVLFCSITSPGLIAIKMRRNKYRSISSFVVLHAILGTAVYFPKRWYFILPLIFWFRPVFLLANSNKVRYVVYGEYIKEQVKARFPQMITHLRSMNLPYDFSEVMIPTKRDKRFLRFGSFGVGSAAKGAPQFFLLADEVKNIKTQRTAGFSFVGHLVERGMAGLRSVNVDLPSADEPLNRRDFERYARDCDYAVFLYRQDAYRFYTSAALYDAFSYGKPIIALRSPMFEYYFARLGDIGHLYADYDELKAGIIELLNNWQPERYYRQCENISKDRAKIGRESIVKDFKAIWEE